MARRADAARARVTCQMRRVALGAIITCVAAGASARAQEAVEPPEVMRAYDLESAGKYREAAQLFRAALARTAGSGALLGLERVYAELQMSDSLLPVLDSLIAGRPREPLYRSVQLRTLQILRREDQLRAAFDRWTRELPRDPTPYREYARILIAMGQPVRADSIVQLSRRTFGNTRDLAFETAQLRAAQGQWTASAIAWRDALGDTPYLASAASYALAPAPAAARDSLRQILHSSTSLGARHALAELELGWGRPQEAWDALRDVTPDTAAATAWTDFGERALSEERFALARMALSAALRVHRTPELALRAATAALRSGAPAEVLTLLPLDEVGAEQDRLVRDYLPLHVAALSALGRAPEAEALVTKYDHVLAPGQHARLSRELAYAWVRTGDLARARAALGTGPDADSSDAAGWLALYEGRLADARVLLRNAREPGPELAFALGIVSRTRGEDGAALGAAFLALARGDSAAAAARFADAAEHHAEAGPALLLAAARLRAGRGDDGGAVTLWTRIIGTAPDAPEAAEAELEWARYLRRHGDRAAAIAHLEHLILSAPQSALLPQARRELELARAAVPNP
jgi:tetratricopeptide (TPR) repeat protein